MQATYSPWLATLSVCVAMLVSYTALSLVARVSATRAGAHRIWLIGGALAMGIGIWSMHFIGMMALSLPIGLRYDIPTTAVSLLIAVITSGCALSIAASKRLGWRRLAVGSLAMGAGICSMHYSGMSAIRINPAIGYDPMLVFASILIAVLASFAALWLAFNLKTGRSWQLAAGRLAAAVAMGLAISGMHYTGMAASRFAAGAYCVGGSQINSQMLGGIIGIITVGLLAIALITAIFDAHLQSRGALQADRLRDINAALETQAAAAHRALRDLQHFHYALDELASVAVTDLAGLITYVNDKFCDITQFARDELLGKKISFIKSDVHPPQFFEEMWDTILAGEVWRGEICNRTKSGELHWMDASIVPYKNEAGIVTRFVTIRTEITQRRQAEDNLRAAKDAAEAANRAKSEFLANMSHEIRTPLNGVIGMTGLLLDGQLGAQQREYAEIVRSSGESLLALINDILDFSKIEAGHLELENIDFDVQSLIEDSIDAVALRAAEKGIELLAQFDPGAPRFFRGDPTRLRQVLLNLLSNAVKFTHSGEVLMSFSAEPREDGASALSFAVRDTGIGIAADRVNTLFAPFIQADSSMTRKFGGTGLGLSISKRLAEAMGGAIEVDSVVGAGSTFHFTVTLLRANDIAAPEAGDRLAGARILVVSSAANSNRALERQLAPEGAELTFADGAEAALELYKKMLGDKPATVAVIDDNIGATSAFWLAQQIRRLPAPPAALILLASLSAASPDAETAQVFDRVITKPTRSGVLAHAAVELTRAPAVIPAAGKAARELPFTGVKILLAEDNPVNQKLACRLLQRMGAEVQIANNGVETLQALQARDFDAVLMDCQMPEMDGYEATRRLRAGESGVRDPRIPVIALTAHALATDRAKCLAAGMDDYLTKPINPALLQRALARSLPATQDLASRVGADDDILFDESALLARTGEDRDFARELVALFIQTGGDTLWELTHRGADADTVRKLAHSLKGSAGSAAARDVAACAATLERVAGSVDAVAALLALEASFKRTVSHWRRMGWIVQDLHLRADTRARVAK